MFQSTYIVQTFAAHLSAIQGSILFKKESMLESRLQEAHEQHSLALHKAPVGALALCAAAVSHDSDRR